ncbi:glycoside hydrolase family 172 protein [Parafilimonas terrae]|uniref:DUF2961 domain-containing protein n=1 Tax=Parafilimonas terrae TaxID=1465490 RepID=A0A1I5TGB4_9BACT|nr:glycoside hydrolase family 172 protein [Parafilimonas terrae]SFP81911.1 Protein of unknown function [Parafilimonas terrae]
MRLIFLCSLLCAATGLCAQKTVTAVDELKQFYNINELPAYRSNTYAAQVSTYDTTGGNNDGFGGQYSFIRRNADSSLVIFDVKGTGVVNRIWTPTPTTDTLDFYIDDAKQPTLSINYMDLFSGKVYPFVQPLCGNQVGGYYCYFPILFQKHCVIVSRGKKMMFHQIGYRLYNKGTIVEPFTTNIGDDVKNALNAISGLWNSNEVHKAKAIAASNAGTKITDTSFSIKPGDTRQVFALNTGGRITGIEISPSSSFASLYKNIIMRVFWDDEKLPAIDCPVADFFGFAFGKPSMQSLLAGSENNICYSFIPMPFDKKARIEFSYVNAKDSALASVGLHAKIYYTLQPRKADKEGKFYAYRNSEKTKDGQPHVFLNIQGKGHYIGTVLQAQGLHTGMTIFFEGDDSTVIDNTMRFHGTGSEDYFNGGWYALLNRWDSKMSLPLHGALDYSLAFARTGGYRFYFTDKMSFEKNIYHSIEHGGEHNAVPGLYTSVSYFYCDRPQQLSSSITNENTKVYIPDTINIYPQFSSVEIGSDMNIKTVWDNNDIGQSFDITAPDNGMLKVNLGDIPAGYYKLFISYAKQPGGCDFSIWQRQTQIAGWHSSSANDKQKVKDMFAGDIHITELNNAATIQFKTAGEANKFLWIKMMLVKK